MQDVQFKNSIITEEEADHIRQMRIEKMKGILQEQGFKVTREEEEVSPEDDFIAN